MSSRSNDSKDSLSPEKLQGVVIGIFALIFFPLLVISSIPNIMFGYESATDDQIVSINDQADYISSIYQQVNEETQACIDQFVSKAKADYSDAGGNPLYDKVEVIEDLGNTNIYWFIAISAVAHEQDLFSMSIQSIRDLVIQKLRWSASLILVPLNTQSNINTYIRVLRVEITELDPEALMTRLMFSEEEKNWARVLYSSMVDTQHINTDALSGGLELGDITFVGAQTNVVYYSQLDTRWCNTMYGKSGTIGQAGCGPTALAMVVASLADSSVTPVDVARWAVENGHRCEGNGSYHSLIPAGARHYGLTVEGIGLDTRRLVQALEDGKLVVAIMGPGHFTTGGHFIVLRGITSGGRVLVADSASVSRSNKEWNLSIFPAEANRSAGSGGPFWVVSPK